MKLWCLHWYCGDNAKYGLFSKLLLQKKLQYGGWKKSQAATNFYKKPWLPVIKWNKKHSSKLVVSITRTLEEMFFAARTFEGLWVVSFETEWKNLCVLWSVWVFFAFLEKRRPNNYCLWEVNLISYIQVFRWMCQNVNLVWNIVVWDIGCVFSYFYGGHKNNFPSWFRSSFK